MSLIAHHHIPLLVHQGTMLPDQIVIDDHNIPLRDILAVIDHSNWSLIDQPFLDLALPIELE